MLSRHQTRSFKRPKVRRARLIHRIAINLLESKINRSFTQYRLILTGLRTICLERISHQSRRFRRVLCQGSRRLRLKRTILLTVSSLVICMIRRSRGNQMPKGPLQSNRCVVLSKRMRVTQISKSMSHNRRIKVILMTSSILRSRVIATLTTPKKRMSQQHLRVRVVRARRIHAKKNFSK